MVFRDLFRPKWKNRKAAVRLVALRDLKGEEQRTVGAILVATDPDPKVRGTAAEIVTDSSLLDKVARTDPVEDVRLAVVR